MILWGKKVQLSFIGRYVIGRGIYIFDMLYVSNLIQLIIIFFIKSVLKLNF